MNWLLSICAYLLPLATIPFSALAAQPTKPRFEDYAVSNVYQGKAAKVVLATQDARLYRTRLREAATSSVDFAGENVLSIFGCGTGCIYGAAVSRKTGKVVFLPGSVSAWYGEGERLQYRPDSRLLIASGEINESGKTGRHYYEFTGSKFRHIMTVPCVTNEEHNACIERK